MAETTDSEAVGLVTREIINQNALVERLLAQANAQGVSLVGAGAC